MFTRGRNPVNTQVIFLRYILLLFFYLRLGLRNRFFPSCFPAKICSHFSSPTCALQALPSHSYWFDHNMDEVCKLWSFSLCIFLQPAVTSTVLGSNILSTPFSDILSVLFSLYQLALLLPEFDHYLAIYIFSKFEYLSDPQHIMLRYWWLDCWIPVCLMSLTAFTSNIWQK